MIQNQLREQDLISVYCIFFAYVSIDVDYNWDELDDQILISTLGKQCDCFNKVSEE